MPDLIGKKNVDWLPIPVYSGETKDTLTPSGTNQGEIQAVDNAIQQWGLENLVRAMCFDTTSSNNGQLSGVGVILEHLLGRPLLHFGCWHHILELVLSAAFGVRTGPSKAPEILVFKRFQEQWSYIDQDNYSDAFSDEFASSKLADSRDEGVAFCQQQLQQHQPRDD